MKREPYGFPFFVPENQSITEAFSASLKANTFSNHQKYSKY